MATTVHVHLPESIAPDDADAVAAQVGTQHQVGDLIRAPSGKQYRVAKVDRVVRRVVRDTPGADR